MTREQYDGLRDRDLPRKATLNRPVMNGMVGLVAGTTVTLTRKFGGFDLEGEACDHCHVRARITRVEYMAVDLLPTETTSAAQGEL